MKPGSILLSCLLVFVFAGALLPDVEAEETTPAYLVWPPYMKQKNIPAASVFAGIEGESRFETNALGIRGPDWGGSRTQEYRILFLGGSATECFYLDQDEAWPALVAGLLDATAEGRKVWSGNLGRSGHNSRDHVLEMRLLVPELPVDAVMVMMGVNDLGLRLAQDAGFNPDFLATQDNVNYQVGHAFSVHPDDPNLPFYRKGVVGRLLGLDPDAQRRKPYQVMDNAGLIFQRFREFRLTGTKVQTIPDLTAALAEYARNAEEIARAGAKMGARVIFVSQPALWREGLDETESGTLWLGGIGDFQEKPGARYYSAAALAAGLDLYNRTLMETCAKMGSECFDLAPKIGRDLSVFYDDCHFNESGARAVASEMARFLSERHPFLKK